MSRTDAMNEPKGLSAVTTYSLRKTVFALGLAAFAGWTATAVHAAQAVSKPVEIVVQGTVHESLFGIAFDGDKGVAVGAAGEVQTTDDGGKTWKSSKLPTEIAMLAVHLDSARAIAVGQVGQAFLKSTGGEWEKVDTGTEKRLFDVSSNVAGLAVAVGEFGGLFLSEDGGRAWHPLTLDWMQVGTDGGAEPHLYGVDVSAEGAITVVGEFGLVLRSEDRGRSWQVVSKASASLFAIEVRENGVGFAVGQDGYALKTTDGGKTWLCIDLGSKAILNGVHSSDDGKVTVTAMREMLVSNDDGTSWSSIDNPEVTTVWYVGVDASATGVMAVGQAGRIVRLGS